MQQNNIPSIKIGVVAVSRDCFPASLAENRRKALIAAYTNKYGADDIYECPVTIIESEIDMVNALEDVKAAGCNALCVYLGNFGPEISETLLAKHFDGPKMFCAAAEESQADLMDGRGDAYCGMLNASYNLKIRGVKAYIPEYPVGDAEDCADMIHDFLPVARAVYGIEHLKIISFGPRPNNFLACNAPIQQLYNLGVEIEENSEYTYRFYDFKRKDAAGNLRELHVEKALQALKTGNRPAAARYEDAPEGIRERMYTTKLLQGLDAYRNESEMLEVVTILDPSADVTLEGVRMRMGTSAVLLPGEEMPLCGCRAMTARPRG